MCGIFGIVTENKISTEKVETISKIIRHRGPDDEGFLLFTKQNQQAFLGKDSIKGIDLPMIKHDNEVTYTGGLLHRRLSIIDLSINGHQPMSYCDRYWITAEW
jgi:asparagine synthase (glutamine-hydrolysing)